MAEESDSLRGVASQPCNSTGFRTRVRVRGLPSSQNRPCLIPFIRQHPSSQLFNKAPFRPQFKPYPPCGSSTTSISTFRGEDSNPLG